MLSTLRYRAFVAASRARTRAETPRFFGTKRAAALLPNLQWDLTPDAILQGSADFVKDAKSVEDRVAAAPRGSSWEECVGLAAEADATTSALVNNLTFLQHVSPMKTVRDASFKAELEINEYSVKSGFRVDVYEAFKSFSESDAFKSCNAEQKRYVEHGLRDYRRKGLHLGEEKRKELEQMQTRLSELCSTFSKNLGEESTTLLFSASELEGLSDDFIGSLEEAGEKRVVTLKYP